MLNVYSVDQLIKEINTKEIIDGICLEAGMKIKILKYSNRVSLAIHTGSNFRKELEKKSNVKKENRWHEEDPLTDYFVEGFSNIEICGLDSRYEYDLNRAQDKCIYTEAWGVKVWKRELTRQEKEKSLRKHRNFYRILHSLMDILSRMHERVYVFDIHSYNHRRESQKGRRFPLFNLGSHYLKREGCQAVYERVIEALEQEAQKHGEYSVENEVFYGKGYMAEYLNKNFENIYNFPIEIKKTYCNENTGEIYMEIAKEIKESIKNIFKGVKE